jgi:hypothetical protein
MPVRLTPTKSLLISYDHENDSWVSIEGISLCLLSEYVDIEPGVTIEHVFRLIDRDAALKKFLSEYCSCDLDAVRAKKPHKATPIKVVTDIECDENGRGIPKATAPVDTVVISPHFYVYTDRNTSLRRLDGRHSLYGKSSNHEDCFITFGGPRAVTYSEVKDFFVTLDTEMQVEECDDEKCTAGNTSSIAFSANVRYTLLDVLTTVVGEFGEPVFDPRYQKEIDEDNEVWDRFTRPNDEAGPANDS